MKNSKKVKKTDEKPFQSIIIMLNTTSPSQSAPTILSGRPDIFLVSGTLKKIRSKIWT